MKFNGVNGEKKKGAILSTAEDFYLPFYTYESWLGEPFLSNALFKILSIQWNIEQIWGGRVSLTSTRILLHFLLHLSRMDSCTTMDHNW